MLKIIDYILFFSSVRYPLKFIYMCKTETRSSSGILQVAKFIIIRNDDDIQKICEYRRCKF